MATEYFVKIFKGLAFIVASLVAAGTIISMVQWINLPIIVTYRLVIFPLVVLSGIVLGVASGIWYMKHRSGSTRFVFWGSVVGFFTGAALLMLIIKHLILRVTVESPISSQDLGSMFFLLLFFMYGESMSGTEAWLSFREGLGRDEMPVNQEVE